MQTPATDGAPEAVEYRGKVRPRDRDTSWDAASAQTNTKTGALQALLYEILRERGPRTHDELMLELDGIQQPYSPSGVRTRMRELELAGWVRAVAILEGEHAGEVLKRKSANGHPATVWRAVLDSEHAPEPRKPEAPKPPRTKGPLLGDESTPEHAAGLAAARRLARWEIGDADWASRLIRAYLDPEGTNARLNEEMSA